MRSNVPIQAHKELVTIPNQTLNGAKTFTMAGLSALGVREAELNMFPDGVVDEASVNALIEILKSGSDDDAAGAAVLLSSPTVTVSEEFRDANMLPMYKALTSAMSRSSSSNVQDVIAQAIWRIAFAHDLTGDLGEESDILLLLNNAQEHTDENSSAYALLDHVIGEFE